MKQEELIKKQLSEYLRWQYPDVIFRYDISADIKLSIGSAVKSKKLHGHSRGYPDLFIAEPRSIYAGLFLEIKTGFEKVYKKNGGFRKSTHVAEQAEMLKKLNKRGYKSGFCFGFDGCKNIIDDYLNLK